jgi:hypothetical protein
MPCSPHLSTSRFGLGGPSFQMLPLLPFHGVDTMVGFLRGRPRLKDEVRNVILQHPVALHRSDFAFCFYAVCMQLQLIFSHCFSLLTLHVLT